MNLNYLNKIYEENKEAFENAEWEITSGEDLKDMLEDYITSNMQYDFDIYIDTNKLFQSQYENKYLYQYEDEYFNALSDAELTIEEGCTLEEFLDLGYNCSTLLSPNEDNDLEDIYITDSKTKELSYNFTEDMLNSKVVLSSTYEDYDGFTCANIELENEEDWEKFKPLLKKEKELELCR